ncbi:hypothetical protein [Flavihumibacter profundi]|jgi:intracellular sulfur oxidation DsrE/DsrF family protein|uniref:hypothetical protein n=1 Tax=Flavihumibacter profundi TaxID=2716883 RepID=UPI001CC76066|nr:hypothetical protein [Flavihumibacter profundi]MBZ5856092.1 hypothetical protein [Flavihumibacter profundi]
MKKKQVPAPNQRRAFLGTFLSGAAFLGLSSLVSPLPVKASEKWLPEEGISDADTWFNKIKGKHRIVYDVPNPHEMFPFAWPRVFLSTNEKTGTPMNESNVVVVLRHNAIPFTMQNSLWEKYKFGEMFKINDPATKAPATRNAFWQPKADDFKVPGIGPVAIGINDLQKDGVMFCVCNMAMTVYSNVIAQNNGTKAEEVYKEMVDGLLPGIQIVPSGVWAVGRAQEHGCAYCFVG